MNILDIIILIVILYYTINGVSKGFVTTIFKIASFFIAILLTGKLHTYFSNILINSKLSNWINGIISQKIYTNNSGGFQENNIPETAAEKLIESIPIPKIIKPNILNGDGNGILSVFKFENIIDQVSLSITNMIISILSIIILFFIIRFLLKLLIKVIEKIMKFPVLNSANKLLGGILGFARGILIVYIICIIFILLTPIKSFDTINNLIENSLIAKEFYNNNFLIKWMM